MEATSKQYQLNAELVLQNPSGAPLKIQFTTFRLTQLDNKITECCLTFQVSPSLYSYIERESLFNLKSDIRGPFMGESFLPEPNIQIEAALQPRLLPDLLESITNAGGVSAYFLSLRQQDKVHSESTSGEVPGDPQRKTIQNPEPSKSPTCLEIGGTAVASYQTTPQPALLKKANNNPLLNTESWFCLSVKQSQREIEAGFNTFWSYVNPAVLQQAAASSEPISKDIANLFQNWLESNLSEILQEVTDEFLNEMTQIFQSFTDDMSTIAQDPVTGELFATVVGFFESDDWPFVQIKDETVLQLAFQGKNGKWACYASTNEERQEFVFYSFFPAIVPADRRLTMAEFLTRANYSITIGNFAMAFDGGEIHYKTSIDVEGDQLSTALVRQLVYANVMVMDHYFPGIMCVLYGNVSPMEAIAQIEG